MKKIIILFIMLISMVSCNEKSDMNTELDQKSFIEANTTTETHTFDIFVEDIYVKEAKYYQLISAKTKESLDDTYGKDMFDVEVLKSDSDMIIVDIRYDSTLLFDDDKVYNIKKFSRAYFSKEQNVQINVEERWKFVDVR